MRDRGPWGRPEFRRGPGLRPPWWPENEPFPPSGQEAWPGVRRRFVRRLALAVGLFFGLMFAANALAIAVFGGAFGHGQHRGFGPALAILAIGALIALVAARRAVRRVGRPVGDVMEAADRVAGGDYGARVEERGSLEMRRLARSFNAMAERLRANEDQRRNFIADVAHELRTPLSVIQGNAEGMLDGLYPADQEHLEPVLDETKVMARLLDDLQTLSTAEAGALRLHREPVAPEQLVEEAVTAWRSGVEAAGVALAQRVTAGLPALDVDAVRIGQVLGNLVSNAVRHTPAGGSVVVSAEPVRGGRAVSFAVTDTGPGIDPAVLPHVFDRFVRSKDSRGSGLGLAIAKSLVEAHGGEVSAESPPGGGTTMRFVLSTERRTSA
ncbi:MAG: HAMP domain-containing histidine kinase [Actinobacteria bacterium]|nr:MAG: HAMP domain-containing histidine kinase [Actinomycetota bacterium]